MTSVLTKKLDATPLKRAAWWGVGVVGAYLLYLLSFGPALLLSGAKASTGWSGLSGWVRLVYAPTEAIIPSFLTGAYDHYVQLWMDMDH